MSFLGLGSLFGGSPYPKIDDKTTFYENVPKFAEILEKAESRKFENSVALGPMLTRLGGYVIQFLKGVPVDSKDLDERRLGAGMNYDERVPKELQTSITYFLLSFRMAISERNRELARLGRSMPAVPSGPIGRDKVAELEARLAKLKMGGGRRNRKTRKAHRRRSTRRRTHA